MNYKQKFGFALLVLLVGCGAGSVTEEEVVTDVPADQPVEIPDPALREKVEDHLRFYHDVTIQSGAVITAGEIGQLGTLEVFSQDVIKDLTGLEFAAGLQILKLGGPHEDGDRQTLDLTPLAGLTNLRILELKRYDITDLTSLAGLTALEDLHLDAITLEEAPAPDLTPLAGLTNLNVLWISDCFITDLTPLAGLTNVQFLTLLRNNIEDISPLAGLTNLWWLSLDGNWIYDLSPLADLTNLQNLDLSSSGITDLSPLAGLTNLESLSLGSTGVTDLTPVANLTNLTHLRLYSTGITDLSPLAGLTNLWNLDLSSNGGITDLSPLADLTNLRELIFGLQRVDYSGICSLTAVRKGTVRAEGFACDDHGQ